MLGAGLSFLVRVAASADFLVAEANSGRAKGPLTLRRVAEMLDEPQRSRCGKPI